MSMVTLQTETPKGAVAAPNVQAAPPSPVLTADGEPEGSKGIQVTARALKRIRVAMAKEHISPAEGGLRVGITGGGCSGLSYSIRFDTHPRERDRIYAFRRRTSIRQLPASRPCASSSIPRASSTSAAWSSITRRP